MTEEKRDVKANLDLISLRLEQYTITISPLLLSSIEEDNVMGSDVM